MISPFRCTWILACVFLMAIPSLSLAQPTANEIIDRIQEQVGLEWGDNTVDTFKTGDPDSPVTGIAVTMMTTLEALQRAAANGHNLIITHEPTFYGHWDETDLFEEENDPIYAAKKAFIDEHGLIIWRFHDYWHRRNPDGIMEGMVKVLGWDSYQRDADHPIFTAPEMTLHELASSIENRTNAAVLRVVGDPDMKLTKIAFAPGASGYGRHRPLLSQEGVEVLVIGEAPEWETVLYADDAIAAGMNKALIMMGHIPSEQAGMKECAEWLHTFINEVPIEFIPTKERFWVP